MLVRESVISETAKESPLLMASTLKPQSGGVGRVLMAGVMLTSLVDAFSILVIYLLVSSSNSGEMLYISKDMVLPDARQTTVLERTTIVKVEDDKYFIEEKEVPAKSLVTTLLDIRETLEKSGDKTKESLTIQADKRSKYSLLNAVILASSHAGFSDIKFAVLAN